MSRIGKEPITIPEGVDVALDGVALTVKGPKGELSQSVHPNVSVTIEDEQVVVDRPDNSRTTGHCTG